MKSSLPRSVLFGFLSWLLPLGLTFIATPIIVHHLGAGEYGLYALVLGFITYSFTFSVGRAVTKYVAEYRATEQTEIINDVLSSTLLLSLLVGATGALILILSANFLVKHVFEIETAMQEKAVTAFYIAAGTIFFLILSQVFSAVLQAVHRFDVFSYITTAVSVLIVGGNLILVLLHRSSVELLIWNLSSTVVGCVMFYFAGRKLLPEARWSLFCRRETLLFIAKFSAGITVSQLLFNFLLLFERGLITRVFGTEGLTYYVVPMNLTGQIHSFSASLLLIIFPLASELGARMETARLQSIYQRVNKYICALVVFLVVTLSVCGHEFFRLWLSPEFADKTRFIVIIQAVTFGTVAIGIVTWQIMEGVGQTNQNAIITVVWVAASLILMIILNPIYELEGVGLGRMLASFTMLVYMLLVERWIFGQTLWKYWLQVTVSLSLAAFVAGLIEGTWLQFFNFGWLGFLIAVGLGGIGFGVTLFITRFLNLDERKNLQAIFWRALPQFSQNR